MKIQKSIMSLLGAIWITMICCLCCEKDVPREGYLISKEFIPAHSSTTLIPRTHKTGKVTTTTFTPMVLHTPDQFLFRLKDKKGKLFDMDVKTVEEYESIEMGDYYKEKTDG
jgi:hypothetical protein